MNQLIVNGQIRLPLRELELSFSRSSGPGGQNVNKVNSKATLRWNVRHSPSLNPEIRNRFYKLYSSKISTRGDLLISSERHRDQKRNIEDCLEKLRAMLLRAAIRPKKRIPTGPSRSSDKKRIETKKKHAKKKLRRKYRGED